MIKKNVNRSVKSLDFILPAPVGGLNKKDPLSDMPQNDAVVMENYIPMNSVVQLRPGYEKYVSLGDFVNGKKVETLCSCHMENKSKMIAVYDGYAYDVSTASARRFENVQFSRSLCQTVCYRGHLYFMNGADTPKVYYIDDQQAEHFEDWGFVGEGLPSHNIVSAGVSHEFLWFIEQNSTHAWVSEVAGNIAGTLKLFDVAQILKWGGHLMAVFNWTIDGGEGLDDYTCLISSEGELLIYQGYNPNDANHFTLMGSYKFSKPIGYQCVLPLKGDVIIISEDGYLPLSQVLSANNTPGTLAAFSDKINNLVMERAALYKKNDGWQGIIYPKKGYGIFNVPVSNTFEQHVVNLQTGAWCVFKNIRSFCWCLYDENLFFGTDCGICRFDKGYSDNGLAIEGRIEQAYTNLGTNALKKITLIKPRVKATGNFLLVIGTDMDFEDRKISDSVQMEFENKKFAVWNQAVWNADFWQSSGKGKIQGKWIANSATGFKASVVFETKTNANDIQWYETALRMETGTGIL